MKLIDLSSNASNRFAKKDIHASIIRHAKNDLAKMHEHYNKSHKNRFEQFAGFKTATILAGLNVYSIKVSLYSFIKQQTLQQQQQQLSINNDEHFVLHPYFFSCSRISVLLLVFFPAQLREEEKKKCCMISW